MEEQIPKGAENFNVAPHIYGGYADDAYDKVTGKRRLRWWVKCPNKRWWNTNHTEAHAYGEVILVPSLTSPDP